MKLKELKNNEVNLLDTIIYFDSIPDTSKYFNELVFKYGNRELTSNTVELFNTEGIHAIGQLFDLKVPEWESKKDLTNTMMNVVGEEKTIIDNKEYLGSTDKVSKSNQENINNDYVIPYDLDTDVKQGGNNKLDNYNNNENIKTDDKVINTKKYSGFDKNRLTHISEVLISFKGYRELIYSDIINMICLQIY